MHFITFIVSTLVFLSEMDCLCAAFRRHGSPHHLVARMGEDGRGHPEALLADGDCSAVTSSKEPSETQMEMCENSTHCT